MTGRICAIAGLLAVLWLPTQLAAETLESGAYSFSDELGGFRLLSVSGSGTLKDPIVVAEEYYGPGPAVLTIRRLKRKREDWSVVPQLIPASLNLKKSVINRSRRNWVGFDLELQEILHTPSSYGDGLSFDQTSKQRSRVSSDQFSLGERTFEPSDKVQFFEGSVVPGAAADFIMLITDNSPIETFYLVQRPHLAMSALPPAVELVRVAADGGFRRLPTPQNEPARGGRAAHSARSFCPLCF